MTTTILALGAIFVAGAYLVFWVGSMWSTGNTWRKFYRRKWK